MLTLELLSPKPTTTLLNTFLTFLTLTFAKDFDILCITKKTRHLSTLLPTSQQKGQF